MQNILIFDDDPADAIILREALLEVDPTLAIDCVDHADAALWRIVPSDLHRPEANCQRPDVVIVGVQRTGSDGCKFVRHVMGQPGLKAPPLVVLAASPCEEEARSKCIAGMHCCVAKPTQYEQYKAMLRKTLNSLPKPSNPGRNPRREQTLCS